MFIEKLIIFRRGYLMSLLLLVTPSNDPPISRAYVFFNDVFYLKLLKLTKFNLVLSITVPDSIKCLRDPPERTYVSSFLHKIKKSFQLPDS